MYRAVIFRSLPAYFESQAVRSTSSIRSLWMDRTSINLFRELSTTLLEMNIPSLVDIGPCILHVMHNSFAKELDAFGSDVENLVLHIFMWFKQ